MMLTRYANLGLRYSHARVLSNNFTIKDHLPSSPRTIQFTFQHPVLKCVLIRQKHNTLLFSTQANHEDELNNKNIDKPLINSNSSFDIEKKTWAEHYAPSSLLPYIQLARLNRPAGTFMLLWPCFWSIALAAPIGEIPDLSMLALFGTGAIIMRSAGCTINDMWDKDFDKQVERTNKRPLASGALTYNQAWRFLALQLSAGLGILMQLNWYTVGLGVTSLGLVITYPLMKRITYWPQAFLGLTFNYGALMGYAAVLGQCNWSIVLPLYAGGVCWTLVYDTLYAHQDKKDDKLIGVKSTALLFDQQTKPILNLFSVLSVLGITASGFAADLNLPFYIGMLGASGHLYWQVNTAKLDDPINLQQRFGSNKWFGALVFSSIVAGNLLG